MDNIVPHHFTVDRAKRSDQKKHASLLVWFTGLSGSGKSTIANALEKALVEGHIHTYLLDGDNVRGGLNSDLSFSAEDRTENIRRIAEVSKLMIDAGLVVLAAFVSPYIKDREAIKGIVGSASFVEVFVNTPLEACEKRDVKGLYAKARKGEILNFTGVNAPYEAPIAPSIEIDTSKVSVAAAVTMIMETIDEKLNNNG